MPKHIHTQKPLIRLGPDSDWRCVCCGKLMGRRVGAAILIQFARGHRYRATRPVSAICRSCGTLNET